MCPQISCLPANNYQHPNDVSSALENRLQVIRFAGINVNNCGTVNDTSRLLFSDWYVIFAIRFKILPAGF